MSTIDAFPHILPQPVFDRMVAAAESRPAQTWLTGSRRQVGLYDLDVRFRVMDTLDDYQQILTLATPPLEQVASGATCRDLARLANDTLAELCQKYPDRFVGFAAGLPMDDPDAAVDELQRATRQLGALGAQIFTNAGGHALDEPRFDPLFAQFAALDKPVWVHGARSFIHPEFLGEDESRYGLWLAFGWPYEMSLCMARLVVTGVLDRYPNLRILVHHGGGMIPSLGQRVGPSAIGFQGPEHAPEMEAFSKLKQPVLDYFKLFYADTTVGGLARAIRNSVEFFGSDHVLFGSDWPFGPASPSFEANLPGTLRAIDALDLPTAERDQILGLNAQRVLGLSPSAARA